MIAKRDFICARNQLIIFTIKGLPNYCMEQLSASENRISNRYKAKSA